MIPSPTGKCFDLLTNSRYLVFMKVNGDQNETCGYHGLKGYGLQHMCMSIIYYSTSMLNSNEFIFIRTGFTSEQVMAK